MGNSRTSLEAYILGSQLVDCLEETQLLDTITVGKEVSPRRVLLYGVHGVGKSTWAGQAPDAVFLPTEDGLGDIDCAKFPLFTDFEKLIEALRYLFSDKHPYKTIIIDSVDWLERLIWNSTCTEHAKPSIESFGYGRGYQFALERWEQILHALDTLRRQKGIACVLLAHTKIERFESPESDSYDRYSPKLHKTASAFLQEWVDEVLFATYRVHVTKEDGDHGKKRGIGSGERIIKTQMRPSHLAKNRLNLPDELPLTWDAYQSFFEKKQQPKQNNSKGGA